ncbi:hypothetical protein ESA94_13635 [Lacibacter luteus]|uniref:Uncharacterized protein n=1 Tax=Lacibacter luteus TaxID=2508719 RepID=A0A4Q1CGV0_9BACT|nr:hypothetical protein [Lacibacter luteus]RXK59177.1 hypothetical protein ESA94_13635 [Lacibacter luteus]
MARGSIQMLGGNRDLTVLTDQIIGFGGANSPILQVPIKIDFGGVLTINKRGLSRLEVLSIKGELKSIEGEIHCSESYTILTRNITLETSFHDSINFSLTSEVVNKIEKYRNGKVAFWLNVHIQTGQYQEISFQDGNTGSFMTGTETSLGQLKFEVEQSKWVNSILPQLGHNSYKLIELPLANDIIPKEYQNSLTELEAARKYFMNGDYDKTVAHCRSAIDPFKQIKSKELREFIESKSELDWVSAVIDATGDWLDKILKATSGFTSKTHHIPSTGHFGRADAEILIMMTTAIVAYVGKIQGKK